MKICHIAPFAPNRCGPKHKPISYVVTQKSGYENIGECWECVSHARDKDGYCQVKIKNRSVKLHRYIYSIYKESPKGYLVCHKCDNPSCINPKHLFLGTFLDNNRDRSIKRRTSRVGNRGNCKGEANGMSKLTEKDVLFIKSQLNNGCSCMEISKIFNMHSSSIEKIKSGKAWAYLKGGG